MPQLPSAPHDVVLVKHMDVTCPSFNGRFYTHLVITVPLPLPSSCPVRCHITSAVDTVLSYQETAIIIWIAFLGKR
jgi:hypothetical protein